MATDIVILKRERASSTSEWGAWTNTTDTAPFTNTDLVEYKVSSELDIEDVTNATTTSNGDGTFDKLMRAINIHIDDQYNKSRLKGTDYATVYLGSMQLAMNQATKWVASERLISLDIDKKTADVAVTLATQQDKISRSEIDLYVADGSKDHKVTLAEYQAQKAGNEASYITAQETAMGEQVIDNRKIKALNSLADTYGTFGAGGLDMTADMWSKYFEIVAALAGGASPTNTGASKVV